MTTSATSFCSLILLRIWRKGTGIDIQIGVIMGINLEAGLVLTGSRLELE